MIKVIGSVLIVIGLLYFFVFGLESTSSYVIMHSLIGTALMLIGTFLTAFDLLKKRRK